MDIDGIGWLDLGDLTEVVERSACQVNLDSMTGGTVPGSHLRRHQASLNDEHSQFNVPR